MPITVLAAGGITVTASSDKAEAGDSVTVSGTATPDTWISIEGTDGDGNILYFSAVLADAAGAYSVALKTPEMDDGTLTFTAGNGSMTAGTTVQISTPSGGDSGKAPENGDATSEPAPTETYIPSVTSQPEDASDSFPAAEPETTSAPSNAAAFSSTKPSKTADVSARDTLEQDGGLPTALVWILGDLLLAGLAVLAVMILKKKRAS